MMSEELIKETIKKIGDDPNREGLIDTPKRVVKMWKEMFKGYDQEQEPKVTTFNNGKDNIYYSQMICDTGIFYSTCEHHMVPFIGKYYFGYVPELEGKLLGLSKVARVVDYFSSKLQIQERLTHEIVEYLWDNLIRTGSLKVFPKAIGLVMDAEHLCKSMRGVKKKGIMRTTVLKGTFLTDSATRAEFMNWVNHNG